MTSVATDWENPTATPAATPAAVPVGLPGLLDVPAALRLLRTHWRRLAAATAIGTVLGVGAWAVWPVRWTATALVMVDPRNAKVTNLDEVLPGIGGDSAAIASIAEIATSDGALMPLVAAENLADDPEFASRSGDTGDVVAALRKAIKVTRRGLTYVIEVAATAKEADKSARLANAVARDIVARQSATRTNASENASGALEGRLADLRAAALASEKAVSDYRMSHGLLDVGPDSTVGQRRLASLAQQAATIRGRLEEAKARFDELKRLKPQDFGNVNQARSDLLANLRGQLSEERKQAAELTRVYGPRHPRVETSQERIAEIEGQIRTETTRLVDQAKTDIDTLQKQSTALESDIAKSTNAELAMNQDEVVLRDLIRQADADRQIYDQFLARQKSTREQASLTRPETEVVSKALPPSKSNRPSIVIFAPVGLALGLLGGAVEILARRRPEGRPARAASPASAAAPVAAAEDFADWDHPAHLRRGDPDPFDGWPIETAPIAPGPAPEAAAFAAPAVRPADDVAGLDPRLLFERLGTPVVAELGRLATDTARLCRGDVTAAGEVALDVADARPAMLPFAETFFPHLRAEPGQALLVTGVAGAVGRTTMALAVARMAESVGLSALVVTDHGEARDLRPSLDDLVSGRHDLAALPPAETVDRVSVMGFGGEGGDGFWDLAEDRRLPAVMARLTREFDLVVVEATTPEDENREAVPATELFGTVLLVADRFRNGFAEVAEEAELWADGGERLVMIGLNAA